MLTDYNLILTGGGFRAFALGFDGMVSCGNMKQILISLHQPFLRDTNARKPLKPACIIQCYMFSCSIFRILSVCWDSHTL